MEENKIMETQNQEQINHEPQVVDIEDLSGIVDVNKKAWIDVNIPGVEGFKVLMKYITTDEVENLREKCTKATFNPSTGQKEFQTDFKCYYWNLISHIVVGWKGLKVKHLKVLLPVKAEAYKHINPEAEVKFNPKNLKLLADYSTPFVNFIVAEVNNINDINADISEGELEKN